MEILDATLYNQDKRPIESCIQNLAHAVIRQSIDDQKIDIKYHEKKLRKYKARPKKLRNSEVLENYINELKDIVEAKQTADDFMINGDLEIWIATAFRCQPEANKTLEDIIDFANVLKNKAKRCTTVRPY